MIIDIEGVKSPPLEGHYDVCIAGGGTAGIVLAMSLATRQKRVLVLEAGGADFSEKSQSLYRGVNVGAPYFELDVTRLRYFGGTANIWGGHCRPFDAIDFEARESIPDSGWPIGISDVQPYLNEARDILEIPAFPDEPALEGSQGRLKRIYLRYSPPVKLADKYRRFFAFSDTVDVFLNANLVDIELDVGNGHVAAFVFRGYTEGVPLYRAVADKYVLSLGGIETPRILLNANRQVPQGLGNETGLVGRFFMEHPHLGVGYYTTENHMSFGDGSLDIGPTDKFVSEEGIGAARFRLGIIRESHLPRLVHGVKAVIKDAICGSNTIVDVVRRFRSLDCGPEIPPGSGVVFAISEQVPNPNSRVSLSDRFDRFGLRYAALDWQLTPLDKKTLRVGALEIGKFMARNEIGKVELFDWLLDDEDLTGFYKFCGKINAGNHHIGTTRMGFSKHDGVVDCNCRMFGIVNLYVAGPSTFRTAGHANPVLMIVQLALRLADYLAQR